MREAIKLCLDAYELSAKVEFNHMEITDADGDFVMRVSRDIAASDLNAALHHGRMMFRAGKESGKKELRHQIATLLDVARKEG